MSVLDASDLNLSPLRGERNVTFIKNAEELADALNDDWSS